jgi:hypothetical protein
VVESYLGHVRLPGALPAPGAAVLVVAAALASMPAARASRVDVLQALRLE